MIDQSIILVDEASKLVRFSENAVALRDAALEKSALIGAVKTSAMNEAAAECLREIEPIIRATEKARKAVKEPFLEACRQIDKSAAQFVEELQAEQLRLRTATGNFAQEQLEIARKAERERQAELDRLERERQTELKRIADEAAAEEQKRQEENRRLQAEAAAAKSKADRERIAKEQTELAKKRAAEDAARAEEAKRQSELAAQAVLAVGPQKEIAKADGQSVKEEWDYEVTDIWTLARMHPGFVKIEPRRAEILSVLAMGTRDIKGLKIFSKITQRFTKGQVIDI